VDRNLASKINVAPVGVDEINDLGTWCRIAKEMKERNG
jgi:hypothetical protein